MVGGQWDMIEDHRHDHDHDHDNDNDNDNDTEPNPNQQDGSVKLKRLLHSPMTSQTGNEDVDSPLKNSPRPVFQTHSCRRCHEFSPHIPKKLYRRQLKKDKFTKIAEATLVVLGEGLHNTPSRTS